MGVGPGEVRSAQAEAYGAPGQTSGTPVHVFAGCGRIYTAANGHRIEAYLYADNTVDNDSLTIRGSASLGPNPVESNQAFLSAEPEIPIASLQDRVDRILRQTVIGRPVVQHVLGDEFVWIQGKSRCGKTRQPGGDPVSYAQPSFDDGQWRPVTLPHDWGVESEFKSFPEALKGSELFPNSFSFRLSIR